MLRLAEWQRQQQATRSEGGEIVPGRTKGRIIRFIRPPPTPQAITTTILRPPVTTPILATSGVTPTLATSHLEVLLATRMLVTAVPVGCR